MLSVDLRAKGADSETTNGHWCSGKVAADPDERRARGPQSL